MNMYDDEFLLNELELAETKEERHEAIVRILEQRPAIRAIMQGLLFMDQTEQDKAINLMTETVKPHTVSM